MGSNGGEGEGVRMEKVVREEEVSGGEVSADEVTRRQ